MNNDVILILILRIQHKKLGESNEENQKIRIHGGKNALYAFLP